MRERRSAPLDGMIGAPTLLVPPRASASLAIDRRLQELVRPREDQSRNLCSIVDRVRPSVEALLAT